MHRKGRKKQMRVILCRGFVVLIFHKTNQCLWQTIATMEVHIYHSQPLLILDNKLCNVSISWLSWKTKRFFFRKDNLVFYIYCHHQNLLVFASCSCTLNGISTSLSSESSFESSSKYFALTITQTKQLAPIKSNSNISTDMVLSTFCRSGRQILSVK